MGASEDRWEEIIAGMPKAPDDYTPECDRPEFRPAKWVKFWPKVWLGDPNVMALKDSEKALYFELLLIEAQRGCLPRILGEISAISRRNRRNIAANFGAISARFFVISRCRIVNRRAEADRKLRRNWRENRSARQMTDDRQNTPPSNKDSRVARAREDSGGGGGFHKGVSDPDNPESAWRAFTAALIDSGRIQDPEAYSASIRRRQRQQGLPDEPPELPADLDSELVSLEDTRQEEARRRRQYAEWEREKADPSEVEKALGKLKKKKGAGGADSA